MKLFFYAYKSWGMTQFDIFHVFVENSVNSELCCFWSLLQPAKIWNLSKNAHVWAAQKTSSNELKIFFDPLLERSWYELFNIIKGHAWSGISTQRGSWGPLGGLLSWMIIKRDWVKCSVYIFRGPCVLHKGVVIPCSMRFQFVCLVFI